MPIEDIKKTTIPDFVVLLFIGALLAIDFLPYFKTIEIINPQFLYLSVINILMGVYFYFNRRGILAESFPILKKSYLSRLYFIFLLLCGISVFAAQNVSLVVTNFTGILIVFLLFINLTILLKGKTGIFYKLALMIGISAFLQCWQVLGDLMVASNHSTLAEGLTQMKGNTGNINILAASLCIKIPFLLLGATYYPGYKKWFLSLTLFMAATAILLTGARTAFVSLFLVSVIYTAYYLKTSPVKKAALIKCIVIIIPLATSIFVSDIVFEKSAKGGRYSSLTKRIERIDVQQSSVQARFYMWNNALTLCKSSPFLGVGLGNYRIESLPYERTIANDYIVSLHTHNDFLEIIAETGVINGLVYFLLFVLAFFINLKRIIKTKDETVRIIALITLLLVIVYGLDSLLNFPMYRPTMQIFLAILFALTIINNPALAPNITSNPKDGSGWYPVVIFLSAISCYSAFLLCKASNLEYLIKTDNIDMKTSGVLNGDEVIERLPLYPNVFSTSESFYEYAGIYYFREKQYEKAHKAFYRADKINPYLGRIDFYKYLMSKERGDLDSAYVYVKKAFYMKPRKLDFYKQSIREAGLRRDSLEILKEHKLFTKYRNIAPAWKEAARGLQSAGYERKKLLFFMEEGLKAIPNDSTLLRQKKDLMITDLIIKGQKFYTQGKPDKSLESYTQALNIDPENIYAMQNIGFHYYNHAQYEKAIGYFKNALKHPGLNDGHTEYYIAMSYLKMKDFENVCKYLDSSQSRNYRLAQQQIDRYCKIRR